MKVFADRTSEDPSVYNIQLSSWKLAVERWRELEARHKEDGCEFNEFFEEACVILVLAGTSVSQLLGQQAVSGSRRVPPVSEMLASQVGDVSLRATLVQFNSLYEDLRHFGEPKHGSVLDIDGKSFSECMRAAQSAWLLIGRPDTRTADLWFRETFTIDWQDE